MSGDHQLQEGSPVFPRRQTPQPHQDDPEGPTPYSLGPCKDNFPAAFTAPQDQPVIIPSEDTTDNPLLTSPRGTPADDSKDNSSQPSVSSARIAGLTSPVELQGARLRSGRTLPGPVATPVSLDKFLDILYIKARESPGISVPQCDALDKRLTQTREQRLTFLKNFKKETERFKEAINNFRRFSRLDNSSDHTKLDLSSESVNSISEPSASEIFLNWLGDSLMESTLDESASAVSDSKSLSPLVKMANYTKVAKLTAQLVPLFSGEPHPQLNQELATFIGCCRQVISCLPPEEIPIFLQIFPTRLRGDAYQLFAFDIPSDFKEVEERLNRTYLPRETYQELVNRLITLRQNPLEALTAFTTRVKRLLMLCKEAADVKYGVSASSAVKTQLEDFAKNALKSGVNNPHLCQYLLTMGNEPLDTLIQKALDMEKLQQSALFVQPPWTQTFAPEPFSPSPRVKPSPPTSHPLGPPQPAYTYTTAQGTDYSVQFPQKPPSSRPPFASRNVRFADRGPNDDNAASRVTCSFCGRKGHTYADCLKRKNTPFCNNCKRVGHDVRDCRSNRPNSNKDALKALPPKSYAEQSEPKGPRVLNIKVKCKFCGRRGHTVEVCRQKQQWETASQGNDKKSTQNSPARL